MTNPWANAAATIPQNTNGINMTQAQRQRQQEITCWLSTLLLMTRVWHVLDGLVGLSLTIYGLTILSSHLHTPIILTLGLGILLLVRAFCGISGVNSDMIHRVGLRVSGVYLSPILGLVFLILSFLCMGKHAVLVDYLQKHASALHLSNKLVSFLDHHHHALWVLLLSCAIMEAIRWWTIPKLHQWLLQMDTSLGSPDVELLYTPNRKPWWWQHSHNNGLHDPLLQYGEEPHWVHSSNSRHYSIHDGTSQNHENSFWSRWFGSCPQEEEESVDFASVQEEWASKSEEDPFWWSREEEETPVKNRSNVKQTENGQDVSWVDEEAGGTR